MNGRRSIVKTSGKRNSGKLGIAAGVPFTVTAGPTREYLDPVRFLSNPSTGRMGFAVARAAAARGFEVTLVAGPSSLRTPKGVKRIDTVSARDMYKAAIGAARQDGVFVGCAAVADWRPAECAKEKLKKTAMSDTIKLVRNPDILKDVATRVKVGFAAETENVVSEAKRKLSAKGCDMVVANDVSEAGSGFASKTDRTVFVFRDGRTMALPLMDKSAVAARIVRECERMLLGDA